jgi:hypothetical protein
LRSAAPGTSVRSTTQANSEVTHVEAQVTTLAWEDDIVALSQTSRYDDTLEVRV